MPPARFLLCSDDQNLLESTQNALSSLLDELGEGLEATLAAQLTAGDAGLSGVEERILLMRFSSERGVLRTIRQLRRSLPQYVAVLVPDGDRWSTTNLAHALSGRRWVQVEGGPEQWREALRGLCRESRHARRQRTVLHSMRTDAAQRATGTPSVSRLIRTNHHLQSAVQNAADVIVAVALDGSIASWNPAAERLLGRSAQEVIGRGIGQLMRETWRSGFFQRLAELANGGGSSTAESVWVDAAEREIPVALTLSPILDAQGQIIGGSVIARDLTERKLTEARLREAIARADAASAAKSEFLASMSHEIRTPLTAILGYTELLLLQESDPAEAREYLEIIDRNGLHLLRVLNDILDLSKVEAGKLSLESVEVPLPALFLDVQSIMAPMAESKGVGFAVEIASPFPCEWHGDPTRLRQVLLNLVSNAIKFTDRGEVAVVVAFTPAPGGGTLQIDVRDSGIGMTTEQAQRVFEPFTQAEAATSRTHGGTGLGLTLCQRFVMAMGGTLRVSSEPGQGTVFHVTLPIRDPDGLRLTAELDPIRSKPAAGPVSRLGGRVLLAEDAPDSQRLVTALLRRLGVEVTLATNGREALHSALDSLACESPFDLILMDVQMPEMDGLEATRLLRHKGYTGPIVGLTAHSLAAQLQECRDAGCDDVGTKPIDRSWLEGIVAAHSGDSGPPAER